MIYYIFKHQIFTIFLSLSHLTAITFESAVQDYVGGEAGDFKVYELGKGKSLVFEPKKKDFNRNFITFLKDKKYYFNLTHHETLGDKDVEIRDGEACNGFSLIRETKDYQLFNCPKSLFFVNRKSVAVKVGDQTITDKSYISKGPPVYVDGELIYFHGTEPQERRAMSVHKDCPEVRSVCLSTVSGEGKEL